MSNTFYRFKEIHTVRDSLKLSIGFSESEVSLHNIAGQFSDLSKLLGAGVVQPGLRVGVERLQPRDVGILLGGSEAGRGLEAGVGNGVLRPGQRLFRCQHLFQCSPRLLLPPNHVCVLEVWVLREQSMTKIVFTSQLWGNHVGSCKMEALPKYSHKTGATESLTIYFL